MLYEVITVVNFGKPGDRAGSQAGEHVLHLPVANARIVEIEAGAGPPLRRHVAHAQAVLLAGVDLRPAGRAARNGELG